MLEGVLSSPGSLALPNYGSRLVGSTDFLLSNHGARISPPGTLREFHNPSSSFPIQHAAGFGSSPVKASSLAKRLDEEMDG